MSPGLPLSPPTEARLRVYLELLAAWTRRINLVSPGDVPHLWARHVEDSLRLLPLVPDGATHAIDLGSGAGFPGLVLAIAGGIAVALVESDRRKAAFLREAVRLTQAPATVHAARIEACGLRPAPLVTARALAPLDRLLPLAAPLLAPGGTMLFPKGARAGSEVEAARAGWHFDVVAHGADTPVLAITNPSRIAVHA